MAAGEEAFADPLELDCSDAAEPALTGLELELDDDVLDFAGLPFPAFALLPAFLPPLLPEVLPVFVLPVFALAVLAVLALALAVPVFALPALALALALLFPPVLAPEATTSNLVQSS